MYVPNCNFDLVFSSRPLYVVAFVQKKMPMVIDHDKTKTVGALILPGIYQRLKNSTETEASLSFSSGYDLAA